jgi:hypothetical protein
MAGPEATIERRVAERAAEELGVHSEKWGVDGWPDRIFFVRGGAPLIIEFKAPGERLEPRQQYRAQQLRSWGYDTRACDDVEKAMGMLRERGASTYVRPPLCPACGERVKLPPPIQIRTAGRRRRYVLRPEEIVAARARHKYVTFYLIDGREFIEEATLIALASTYPDLARVSRDWLVRLDKVTKFELIGVDHTLTVEGMTEKPVVSRRMWRHVAPELSISLGHGRPPKGLREARAARRVEEGRHG